MGQTCWPFGKKNIARKASTINEDLRARRQRLVRVPTEWAGISQSQRNCKRSGTWACEGVHVGGKFRRGVFPDSPRAWSRASANGGVYGESATHRVAGRHPA